MEGHTPSPFIIWGEWKWENHLFRLQGARTKGLKAVEPLPVALGGRRRLRRQQYGEKWSVEKRREEGIKMCNYFSIKLLTIRTSINQNICFISSARFVYYASLVAPFPISFTTAWLNADVRHSARPYERMAPNSRSRYTFIIATQFLH